MVKAILSKAGFKSSVLTATLVGETISKRYRAQAMYGGLLIGIHAAVRAEWCLCALKHRDPGRPAALARPTKAYSATCWDFLLSRARKKRESTKLIFRC